MQLVPEPLEETWPPQLPSGPPRLLGFGVQVKQPPYVRPRRPPRRDQASLSAGPAPGATAPPRGARARTAIMICLVLTIFANLFPAACIGAHERTFLAVKPDGVQRRLVGEIVRRFERKGFKLVALKLVQVWQGLDVVRTSRALIGATNPADAPPGTIRGDFCIEVGKNLIHGSDSVESARREIALWFRADELLCWEDSAGHWLYE
ncbi:PREDICTED: nucleoside diphosphate kinase 3 isoform X3 [Rhinopithecus bieti]|uniref:nucleoside diphosphate kinase 3 isoform X3 n=1 Tax=Rhinopithecus bieti TaxID=61621 RepID=UPI00083C8521|nr:PREDICTED: nucleoside diphosphate kinase 3 isoform X3 [Rhinopithecus bieti]